MIGLLRRSPDPFMQLIPEGMHAGGTTMVGSPPAMPPHAEPLFARLMRTGALDQIVAQLAALHEERKRRYAQFSLFGGRQPC